LKISLGALLEENRKFRWHLYVLIAAAEQNCLQALSKTQILLFTIPHLNSVQFWQVLSKLQYSLRLQAQCLLSCLFADPGLGIDRKLRWSYRQTKRRANSLPKDYYRGYCALGIALQSCSRIPKVAASHDLRTVNTLFTSETCSVMMTWVAWLNNIRTTCGRRSMISTVCSNQRQTSACVKMSTFSLELANYVDIYSL